MLKKILISILPIIISSNISFASGIENFEPQNLPDKILEYKLSHKKFLTSSKMVSFNIYQADRNEQTKSIKLIAFDPRVIDLVIQYSDILPKHFTSIMEQPGFIAAVNGVTVSDFKPQGDIKGQNLNMISKDVNVYQLKNDETAVNLRHSVGVKHNGMVDIIRDGIKIQGGLIRGNDSLNHEQYKYFINGAALLFDKTDINNEKDFLKNFRVNNDKDLVKNMIPDSRSARTILGITLDDKVIIGSFGEGRYGDGSGFSAFDVYNFLKNIGVKKSVMFDGGSASAMITKDNNGYVSHPKIEYTVNSSFISIFDI